MMVRRYLISPIRMELAWPLPRLPHRPPQPPPLHPRQPRPHASHWMFDQRVWCSADRHRHLHPPLLTMRPTHPPLNHPSPSANVPTLLLLLLCLNILILPTPNTPHDHTMRSRPTTWITIGKRPHKLNQERPSCYRVDDEPQKKQSNVAAASSSQMKMWPFFSHPRQEEQMEGWVHNMVALTSVYQRIHTPHTRHNVIQPRRLPSLDRR